MGPANKTYFPAFKKIAVLSTENCKRISKWAEDKIMPSTAKPLAPNMPFEILGMRIIESPVLPDNIIGFVDGEGKFTLFKINKGEEAMEEQPGKKRTQITLNAPHVYKIDDLVYLQTDSGFLLSALRVVDILNSSNAVEVVRAEWYWQVVAFLRSLWEWVKRNKGKL